jgi:hypothetical protein
MQAKSETMSFRNLRQVRLTARLLAALVAGLLLLMPTSSEARVDVRLAPPVPTVETVPLLPGPGYDWLPGSWVWVGDHYVWHHGYYALRPFPSAVWVEGHWPIIPVGGIGRLDTGDTNRGSDEEIGYKKPSRVF